MLLAQAAWNRQDGRVKRISSQVLAVEFAALVWDSSVNGALGKSYVKRKQEKAPCHAKCNKQHTFQNTFSALKVSNIALLHIEAIKIVDTNQQTNSTQNRPS